MTEQDGVLIDERGNRATIDYWGSREEAERVLKTLEFCSDCSGCSDCSDCSHCSGCSRCSRCSRCSGCSDCSDCSGCSGCSGCSDCSDCSGCSRCSDCSGCSRCSDCSHCSRCSGLDDNALAAMPAVPAIEGIHRKVYEAASQPKALNMTDWHSCETTHCRAGWIVHLAGKEGYDLEAKTSALFAAQQIYRASGYDINPCRFYDSNDQALADMKRLAEEEAALAQAN